MLGYSINETDKAVVRKCKKGNLSTFNCPEEVLLARKLISFDLWFDKAKFTRSGGEANAIAIRLARSNTEKHNVYMWLSWLVRLVFVCKFRKKSNLDQHLLSGLSLLVLKKLK